MDEQIEAVLALIESKYGDEIAAEAFHFLYGTAGMPRPAPENPYGIELVAAFHDALERWLLKHDPDAATYLIANLTHHLEEG